MGYDVLFEKDGEFWTTVDWRERCVGLWETGLARCENEELG